MRNVRVIFLWLLIVTLPLAAGCGEPLLAPATTAPVAPGAVTTSSTAVTSSTTSTSLSPAQAAVEGMTVRQKAAQVLLVTLDGTSPAELSRGVLSQPVPAGFLLLGRDVSGESQLRSLTAALQEAAGAVGAPGLFIAADQEGGTVMRVKHGVPALPSARALATDSTPSHAGALADETAIGLLSQGVNMVLAPVADVVADRDSFLFSRTYGGEPGVVSAFVTAVTGAFVDRGIVTVVKHFPGHGSAPGNSHTEVPVSTATRAEFARVHLPPFEAAIAAGADGVMMGHFLVPAYDPLLPASQSEAIVGDLLRRDLGFAGLIVTDDLEMAAAAGRAGPVGMASAEELGNTAVAALTAGCDLLVSTGAYDRREVIEQAIVDAVQAGKLSEERLNDAVIRVLAAKIQHSIPVPGPQPN